MHMKQWELPAAGQLTCPECQGTRFRVGRGKVECTNCGWSYKTSVGNKYGAKTALGADGKKRHSKFESTVADELLFRKRAGDIKDYDSQYKIEAWAYRSDGVKAFKVQHKVDFRLHLNDGSYELLEAKGVETDDYKWRRKFLEHIWLPEHPDHTYSVIKQGR